MLGKADEVEVVEAMRRTDANIESLKTFQKWLDDFEKHGKPLLNEKFQQLQDEINKLKEK